MMTSRWVFSLAVAALTATGCAPLTNRVLLFPSRDDRPLEGAERTLLFAPSGTIETIRASSPGARTAPAQAVVLRFYGNAARADAAVAREAEDFGPWPVEVWGVNYPGFGRSEGGATLDGVVQAADTAYAEAAKRALPIYVMGTSMGTAAALHLAASREVRGLFLHNPPPLPELIRGHYGWWNLWLLAAPISWSVPDALDSVANARRSRAPAVIVSSEDDGIVPLPYQSALFEAYAGPKERIVVPGAGHNDPIPEAAWRAVRAALARQGWASASGPRQGARPVCSGCGYVYGAYPAFGVFPPRM